MYLVKEWHPENINHKLLSNNKNWSNKNGFKIKYGTEDVFICLAAVTNYTLGDLSIKHLFLTVLKAEKSKIKVLGNSASRRDACQYLR